MTKPAATVRVIINTCICLCPSVQMESDGWFFVVVAVSVMVISGGMVREMKRQKIPEEKTKTQSIEESGGDRFRVDSTTRRRRQ
ncbi:hypothetical protein L1887_05500 [Cichorium endivia]|nr:hypothetical protein L1887_05500 [Cichorium endivia]